MKLLNSFFYITNESKEGERCIFDIHLNPEHVIYKAHFPEKPVTPGVCSARMITELTEYSVGNAVRLKEIKNVKFLSPIDPRETPDLRMVLDINGNHVKAEIKDEHVTYAKFSMIYELWAIKPV